jgi:hypothetical protein
VLLALVAIDGLLPAGLLDAFVCSAREWPLPTE